MATIEPRLIHLLNTTQTPDLPPIQQLLPLGSGSGSAPDTDESLALPPLEPDPSQRGDRPPPPIQIPPLHAVSDDPLPKQSIRTTDNAFSNDGPSSWLGKPAHPLQHILGDIDANTSTLSLRMLVQDNTPDGLEDPSTKKRHRALTTKEDFVQLPQPLKKQKSNQQVVPPIIAGLHEPPPNAAVFPPITSGSFDDNEALGGILPKDFGGTGDERASGVAPHAGDGGDKNNCGAKVKRRAAKPRRKWSDEETNQLLLGVSRHGVGKWTSILEDPSFKFNDRTAGDLKDRFRTCCPEELRAAKEENSTSRIHLENILVDPDILNAPLDHNIRQQPPQFPSQSQPQPQMQLQLDSDAQSSSAPGARQRKSRAHRKKMEDLVELGIHGPFKKSHRRERRPFTEQDDREILEGLDLYGPAWTKIQRDRRFNLSTRQPTDLRDRVRNKYPDTYARIEKGVFHVKGDTSNQTGTGSGSTGGNALLEPAVNTMIDRPLHQHMAPGSELNRSNSREDMLAAGRWGAGSGSGFYESSSENLPALADVFVDMPASGTGLGPMGGGGGGADTGSSLIGPGGMDIGRLLLEDGSGPGPGSGPGSAVGEYHHPSHSYHHGHRQAPYSHHHQQQSQFGRSGVGSGPGYDYGTGR